MTAETPTPVPDNPFTHHVGKQGMEWLEYLSTFSVPTAPAVGERRYQTKQLPMQFRKGLEPYDQVLQLFKRCQHFEAECERVQAEVKTLREDRERLFGINQAVAEEVSEGRQRKQRVVKEG